MKMACVYTVESIVIVQRYDYGAKYSLTKHVHYGGYIKASDQAPEPIPKNWIIV